MSNRNHPHWCVLFQSTYKHSNRYCCPTSFSDVFFIDATTTQTIDAKLKDIALGKEIGENMNNTIIWLAEKHKEWLLLFNIAGDTMLNLFQFFPSCSHGNILITS
jgi:hypothetical protein